MNKVYPQVNTILDSSMINTSLAQLPTGYQPTPVDISFKDITYSVQVEKDSDRQDNKLSLNKQQVTKTILDNVSGVFKAGEMTAIIGVSGCGKTSLLNIIACRIDTMEGQLLANGKPYNYETFGNFANYVMQTDLLMETMTVKETLQFAADLRLNKTAKEKEQKIRDLCKNMKLQKCMDTLVGGQTIKGVSGGQRKRTSIALELIGDPQVLILDEPTSGLDSLTSFVIVNYLKRLAKFQNRTVIMTIHQPSQDIYEKFDKLMLMLEGRFVYQGSSQNAISYFEQNFQLKCAQFQNSSEFLVHITHDKLQQNKYLYPQFHESYSQILSPQIDLVLEKIETREYEKRINQVGWCYGLGVLLKRELLNLWRNPAQMKNRIFQCIFLGIFVGGVYFGLGKRDYTQNISWFALTGFIFFHNFAMFTAALTPVTLIFPFEKQIFLKEENSRLYNVFNYFVSKNIIEIPYFFISPIFYMFIFYWMVGLESTFEQYFLFLFITFLMGLCGNSLGLLLGSIINDPKAVAAATSVFIIPFYFQESSKILTAFRPGQDGFNIFLLSNTDQQLLPLTRQNTGLPSSIDSTSTLDFGNQRCTLPFWLSFIDCYLCSSCGSQGRKQNDCSLFIQFFHLYQEIQYVKC